MSFDSNSLSSLCYDLDLDRETIKEAEKICNSYLKKHSIQQPMYLYIASSIIAATRSGSYPPNFLGNALKNLKSPEEFIDFFKHLLREVEAESSCYKDCEDIIENYTFSWLLYKKFVEKWAQLELSEKQGHSGTVSKLRELAWTIVALKRSKSESGNNRDLVENA